MSHLRASGNKEDTRNPEQQPPPPQKKPTKKPPKVQNEIGLLNESTVGTIWYVLVTWFEHDFIYIFIVIVYFPMIRNITVLFQ